MDMKKFYVSTPCEKCGCTLRYIRHDTCKQCKAESNRRYRMKIAAEKGLEYKPRRKSLVPVKTTTHRENVLKMMINIFMGMFMNNEHVVSQP